MQTKYYNIRVMFYKRMHFLNTHLTSLGNK